MRLLTTLFAIAALLVPTPLHTFAQDTDGDSASENMHPTENGTPADDGDPADSDGSNAHSGDSSAEPAATPPASEEKAPEVKAPEHFPVHVTTKAKDGIELRVSGEVRLREELFHHVSSTAYPNGDKRFEYTHMRTRLRVDAVLDEQLTVTVELQDVRVLGGAGSTVAVTGGVDVKRAQLTLTKMFDLPLALEAGRYVMMYGDERIIGALEWVDQGRTYDGARLMAGGKNCDWFADLFAVRLSDAAGSTAKQGFFGFYGGINTHRKEPPPFGLEIYSLLLQDERVLQGETTFGGTFFNTTGLRLAGAVDGLKYTAEFAAQFGKIRGDDLKAFAFAVTVLYALDESAMKLTVGAGLAYASGDKNSTDGQMQTFQTLFPTNHKFYGIMDIMAWSNMWNIHGWISMTPTKGVVVRIDFHHLALADPRGGWFGATGTRIRAGAAGISREIGQEIDAVVQWTINPHLRIEFGWAHLFAGGFIGQTPGRGRDSDFGYVQLWAGF